MKDFIQLLWDIMTDRLNEPAPVVARQDDAAYTAIAAETYRRSIHFSEGK
jgi:hypothetical protein